MNEFSMYHNKLLVEELEKLRKLHPDVSIIYADYYGPLSKQIENLRSLISKMKFNQQHYLPASSGLNST
jgi:hypothetical protein